MIEKVRSERGDSPLELVRLQRINVMASCSASGIFAKESRGVLADQGQLPTSLISAKAAAVRVASRLGIDISAPSEVFRAQLQAISVRPNSAGQARVVRGPSDDFDLS